MADVMFIGPAGPRGRGRHRRGQAASLRESLESLAGLPRALKLVWETHRGITLLLAASTLGQAVLPAATAWAGKLVIDAVMHSLSTPGAGLVAILPALVFAAGVALAGLVLGTVSRGAEDVLRERLTYRVNTMVLKKALTLDLEFFETPEKQDMLQRAWQEAGFRPMGVLRSTFSLIQGTISLISVTALLVRFSLWVLLLLAVTGIPSLLVQRKLSRESFGLLSGRAPLWRKLMYYSMLLTQSLHVKEIKLFGLGSHLYGRYEEMSRRFARENASLALRRNAAGAALQPVAQIGYYAAYAAVIAQALRGRLTIGDLTLYSGLLMQAPMIAQSLMRTVAELYESNLFLGNLFGFLAAGARILPGDGTGAKAPEVLSRGIEFHGVSFRYPGAGEEFLHDVSIHIRPGEKIALVGENGAGKTTLIKLLTRLYDPHLGPDHTRRPRPQGVRAGESSLARRRHLPGLRALQPDGAREHRLRSGGGSRRRGAHQGGGAQGRGGRARRGAAEGVRHDARPLVRGAG